MSTKSSSRMLNKQQTRYHCVNRLLFVQSTAVHRAKRRTPVGDHRGIAVELRVLWVVRTAEVTHHCLTGLLKAELQCLLEGFHYHAHALRSKGESSRPVKTSSRLEASQPTHRLSYLRRWSAIVLITCSAYRVACLGLDNRTFWSHAEGHLHPGCECGRRASCPKAAS